MILNISDANREIRKFEVKHGVRPQVFYLCAAEFVGVADELCRNHPNIPDLTCLRILNSNGSTTIRLVRNGLVQGTLAEILCGLQDSGHATGNTIKLGGYTWMVPCSSNPPTAIPGNQSGKSTFTQWAVLQSQSVKSINGLGPDGSGTINPTSEPACRCVSPSEHDTSCAWLAWKRNKK
jgi:hypothetical protein